MESPDHLQKRLLLFLARDPPTKPSWRKPCPPDSNQDLYSPPAVSTPWLLLFFIHWGSFPWTLVYFLNLPLTLPIVLVIKSSGSNIIRSCIRVQDCHTSECILSFLPAPQSYSNKSFVRSGFLASALISNWSATWPLSLVDQSSSLRLLVGTPPPSRFIFTPFLSIHGVVFSKLCLPVCLRHHRPVLEYFSEILCQAPAPPVC